MQYPVQVKRVFTRIQFQAQDIWQNFRRLKRHISQLVHSIDDVAHGVSRSRQILHGIGSDAKPQGERR